MARIGPNVRGAKRTDSRTGPESLPVAFVVEELVDAHRVTRRAASAAVVGNARVGAHPSAGEDHGRARIEQCRELVELGRMGGLP